MDMDTSLPRQTISSSLQAQTVHERRRAIAALLRRPLLTPGEKGASDFMLVRRHTAWLREWFMRHCQWTLHVESELARLRKTPGDLNDSTRPLLDTKEQSFTRRRYVVLCLALAVLEKSERQTVLRRLASPASLRPIRSWTATEFPLTWRCASIAGIWWKSSST